MPDIAAPNTRSPLGMIGWPALGGVLLGFWVPGPSGIILMVLGLGVSAKVWSGWVGRGTDIQNRVVGPGALGILAVLLLGSTLRIADVLYCFEGVSDDRAGVAWTALRILHEGWRPWGGLRLLQVPEPLTYYALAAWFAIAGASIRAQAFFDVALWALSAPLWYSVFRRWGGTRVAFFALVFYAASRWGMTYTGHQNFSVEIMLITAACLEAWGRGVERSSRGWVFLAGLVAGSGFYAYQASKVLGALLIVLALWELRELVGRPQALERLVWMSAGWALAVLPIIVTDPVSGWFGRREGELWIFGNTAQGGWTSLGHNLLLALGMFHAHGDPMADHNLRGWPELDPVMGILAAWGVGWALHRLRRREGVAPLLGLLVMCLPMALSRGCPNDMRSLGMLPFLCFLAATALEASLGVLNRKFPSGRVGGIGWGILGAVALWNGAAYFGLQVRQEGWRDAFNRDQTELGQALTRLPSGEPIRLAGPYAHHSVVRYAAYPARESMEPLDASHLPKPPAVFVLDPLQGGLLEYLQERYPAGNLSAYSTQPGPAYALIYQSGPMEATPSTPPHGLWRTGTGVPDGTWDPVVDFAWRDLPQQEGLKEFNWSGTLQVDRRGIYLFRILCGPNADAILSSNGQDWVGIGTDPGGEVALKQGRYPITLRLKVPGDGAFFMHLLWKKPDSNRFEAIPNTRWGILQRAGDGIIHVE